MTTHKKTRIRKFIFSIKAKVALLCTCFIIIAIATNYSFLMKVSKTSIENNTEVTMEALADSYSSSISKAVQQVSQSANFMMTSSAISTFVTSGGTGDTTDVEELISMFLSTNTSYEDISIVDAEGIILYSSNNDLVGTDLSKETYFTEMVSSGLSSQGNVFSSDSSGDACTTFAIPLRDDMQIVGIGSATMSAPPVTEGTTDTATTTADTTTSSTDSTVSIADSAVTPTDSTLPADQGALVDLNSNETAVTEFTGAIVTNVKVSEFGDSLSELTVGNHETGYAYLLDSAGTYVYHPEAALIGTTVDVEEISAIISQLQAGTASDSSSVTYSYDGVTEYAGYSIDTDTGWILFIAADQAEVLSALDDVTSTSLPISLVLIFVLTILAYLFAGTITKPIKKITSLINKTAELDFTTDDSFSYLSTRNDETGEMSRAIERMREVLNTILSSISKVSSNIDESSKNLTVISHSVNDHASDNSATAEELSASMEETAATTEQIYTSIEQISDNSKDINNKVMFGAKLSTDLITRAQEMKMTSIQATENTKQIYANVKQRTDLALEQSKAVDKIQIFTKTIQEIASQTNLLALNASIEAARAGDAGRGFSVVASEIGNLASQSSQNVTNITKIVDEVYLAVENMSHTLEETLTFLENNVLKDYAEFIDSSEQYNSAAVTINDTMDGIHSQINLLDTNLHSISDSISEINSMVNESSCGVNEVAEKNTDIVALTNKTQLMAQANTDYANGLK
ncbi:MAG: methyl-accepting chemotaxis protein, partial [Mobilitalea sp.]